MLMQRPARARRRPRCWCLLQAIGPVDRLAGVWRPSTTDSAPLTCIIALIPPAVPRVPRRASRPLPEAAGLLQECGRQVRCARQRRLQAELWRHICVGGVCRIHVNISYCMVLAYKGVASKKEVGWHVYMCPIRCSKELELKCSKRRCQILPSHPNSPRQRLWKEDNKSSWPINRFYQLSA
jgi:hypothetical protein